MPEAAFADTALASLYDPLDPDRGDLEPYLDLVRTLGARSVLDVGCGTGTFALLLARRGVDVVAVDPAPGMITVACAKPSHAELRFRTLAEVADSLSEAGLDLVGVRDAPDRPGREHVVLARRPS